MWITTNGKFLFYFIFWGEGGIFNEMGIPNMEQWTGSKLGKEYVKAVHWHRAYLTSMRVHHVKCQAGWITSWNQDCQEKYQ